MSDETRKAFEHLNGLVNVLIAHFLTDDARGCPPVPEEKRQELADRTQSALRWMARAVEGSEHDG